MTRLTLMLLAVVVLFAAPGTSAVAAPDGSPHLQVAAPVPAVTAAPDPTPADLRPQRTALTRQPVVVLTIGSSGRTDFGATDVAVTANGRGGQRLYADPFAAQPLGVGSATVTTQEGVAVVYVESTLPGEVTYTATSDDYAAGSATGTVADDVPATERVATIGLEVAPSGPGRFVVTASARDLYARGVGGDVELEVFAFGPDAAAALPGGEAATLPEPAGTAALRQVIGARGGQARLDLRGVDDEVTLMVRVLGVPERDVLDAPTALLRLPFVGTPRRDPRDRSWEVTSYNVHYGTPQGGSYDPTAAPAALREVGTDVALLQEVDDDFYRSGGDDLTARYAAELGMQGVYAPSIAVQPRPGADTPQLFGNAVLSRDPLERAQVVTLPRLLPGRFTGARTVLSATVASPAGRRVVADIHLDLNQGERLLQGRAIRTVVADHGAAFAALGGDLNTSAERPDFQLLAGTPGLYDAWPAAGTPPGSPGYTFRALDPFIRIDVVFPSDSLATTEAVVGSLPASDHLPVRASLSR